MTKRKNPILVGIIGYGRSGHGIHSAGFMELKDLYEVRAIYDPLEDRRSDSRWPNAASCVSRESLLCNSDVELVVVASPNKFHSRDVVAALEHGKHVVGEKPFGFTLGDVDAMVQAAEKAGKVVQPFQQRRYEEDFNKALEICRSGLLGKITFIRISWSGFSRRWDWQTTREFGGGQLYNNGPHPVDHALEFLGDQDPKVWCNMRNSLSSGDAEDEIQIVLTSENAPVIQIDLLATSAYPQDRWYICGTSGSLRGSASELQWRWVDWKSMPSRPLDTQPTDGRTYNVETLAWQEGVWKSENVDGGAGKAPGQMPTLKFYRDLWSVIREGSPQVITPQSVRRRVKILETCYKLSGVQFPEESIRS